MPIHDRATQKRQQEAIHKKHQKETHHPQLTKTPGRGITPEGSGQGRAAYGGANAALTSPPRRDTPPLKKMSNRTVPLVTFLYPK